MITEQVRFLYTSNSKLDLIAGHVARMEKCVKIVIRKPQRTCRW
jgi:hypothetical protein